jgi:rhodanese-related sulfurtransferase
MSRRIYPLLLVLAMAPPAALAETALPPAAIAAYLAEKPIENYRLQPDSLPDDPRDDFYFVVDVREPAEFAEGAIAGAVNLPYHGLPQALASLPQDRGAQILVYCDSTARSTQALMTLRLLGYGNVWYLNGGVTRWQREGRPLAHAGP